MANGLISASRYGGPAETIVEDPNETPVRPPEVTQNIVDDSTPDYTPTYTPTVPTSADVAPPDRNIVEENNWMQQLQDYANQRFPDNEAMREKFIEQTARMTRNNIAMQRASNRQILLNDQEGLDKVLFDMNKFQGRGPRNDYEAYQVNPGWQSMRAIALDHNPAMQKHIDAVFEHNGKMDVPETTDRTERFNQANGLLEKALAGKPGIDKYEVLQKLDPTQLDLSKRQVGILRHGLSALKSQKDIDNQKSHYMTVAQGLLNEVHIYSSNDKLENQFWGALSSELKKFQASREHPEAPLDDNDVLSITARLIRDRSSGWNPFAGPDRAFMVPDNFYTEENRQQFESRYGRAATPEDIYNLYQISKAQSAR